MDRTTTGEKGASSREMLKSLYTVFHAHFEGLAWDDVLWTWARFNAKKHPHFECFHKDHDKLIPYLCFPLSAHFKLIPLSHYGKCRSTSVNMPSTVCRGAGCTERATGTHGLYKNRDYQRNKAASSIALRKSALKPSAYWAPPSTSAAFVRPAKKTVCFGRTCTRGGHMFCAELYGRKSLPSDTSPSLPRIAPTMEKQKQREANTVNSIHLERKANIIWIIGDWHHRNWCNARAELITVLNGSRRRQTANGAQMVPEETLENISCNRSRTYRTCRIFFRWHIISKQT